jgi:hypothetical protein
MRLLKAAPQSRQLGAIGIPHHLYVIIIDDIKIGGGANEKYFLLFFYFNILISCGVRLTADFVFIDIFD